MSLKERVYSVLVVSATETFNSNLSSLLPNSTYHPILTVSSVSAAKRCLAERSFDFIIVNSPLTDDTGINFAIDAVVSKETVVLLLIKNELHDAVYDKVAEHGVFTLPKPTSKSTIVTALNWMASSRERLRKLEKKTSSIEKKMEDIRIVNRAKWLLISELKMSESEAHKYIEKQAMDNCISKRKIAEDIIKTYS